MTAISISEWLGKDAAGICGKRMKEILANGVAFGPVTMKDQSEELSVPIEAITRRIFLIRGQKVMLDSDLAELYQVQTKVLNQAVHRNEDRFPDDFLFQLTEEESSALRSQFVTLEKGVYRTRCGYAFLRTSKQTGDSHEYRHCSGIHPTPGVARNQQRIGRSNGTTGSNGRSACIGNQHNCGGDQQHDDRSSRVRSG